MPNLLRTSRSKHIHKVLQCEVPPATVRMTPNQQNCLTFDKYLMRNREQIMFVF